MTKKYIDAEVLKNNMHKCTWVHDMKCVEKFVDMLPAADVVEVCRCGECENWKADFPYNTCALFGGRWNENMFCSYGRRKNG